MSRLHVEVRGAGPPVVMLHGWGLNVRVWDTLGAALEARARLIALDLPGHGRSPWRADRAAAAQQVQWLGETVAEAIGAEPYSLLGWSLGGQLALAWAAAPPAGLPAPAHLALIGATPRFTAAPDWPHGTPEAQLERLAEGLRRDYHRTVSDFLDLQVRASAAGEAVLEQLRTALFTHGEARPEALAAGLELLRTLDLRAVLGSIGAPTLAVAGQYDRVLLPAATRALAAALPHARFAEIRRAAHAPFLSHTAEVADLLSDFLGAS
jgi:pimeloyl-[acyl-carrier protein] methyl ester esterase